MEVNGVAHIQLSVNRFEECVAFYDQLMPFLGLRVVHRADNFVYYVGGRTGYAISRADPKYAGEPHDAMRPGLHHYCFRARSREDVDGVYALLHSIGATIIRAPEEGPWGAWLLLAVLPRSRWDQARGQPRSRQGRVRRGGLL